MTTEVRLPETITRPAFGGIHPDKRLQVVEEETEPGEEVEKFPRAKKDNLQDNRLQMVKEVTEPGEEGKKAQAVPKLTYKQRFRQIAIKVLTKIVTGDRSALEPDKPVAEDNKGIKEDPQLVTDKESENKEAKQSVVSKVEKVGPASIDNADILSPATEKPKPPKKLVKSQSMPRVGQRVYRPSFASIARLARFRRMSGLWIPPPKRTPSRKRLVSAESDVLPEDDHVVLPALPRFGATLSPEAQYAMLRGYEDLIISDLRESYPDSDRLLHRSSTPKQVALSPLKDEHSMQSQLNVKSSYHLSAPSSARSDWSRITSDTDIFRFPPVEPDLSSRTALERMSDNSDLTRSESEKLAPSNGKTLSKSKQLHLTYRFQRAMNIVDTLRVSKGHTVTSPRNVTVANPVQHYQSWANSWTKEFSMNSTKVSEHK